ncbi:SAM-dependent methyltransferase [Streptomyces sp. NPDC017979]|uniref:SAM-dependent methyltransferase n=1 Tax=Streptomyces sp. NPDC017979 TaxID=3365024 RepID=UPI0037B7EB78
MTGNNPRRRIDTSVAHSARVWNYWLGGKDNYPADQIAGEAYERTFPPSRVFAQESRHFLRRMITYLAGEAGIRQFLDLGAGLPTVDNTHEVAQRIAPDARIVYVDHDPIVIRHVDALLTSTPQGATHYVESDMQDTAKVLAGAAATLDLNRPVALVCCDVLGHIVDFDEALGLIDRLMRQLPSGSHLALSHCTGDGPEHVAAQDAYNATGAIPYILRPPEQIARFFEGLDLIEPGLVSWPNWRPDATTGTATVRAGWGAVGRKP